MQPSRCHWVSSAPLYQAYHDQEWGQVCVDDQSLFIQLCLEGQQAGLSWWTVLQKRACYHQHFFQYSIQDIAQFSDAKLEQELLLDKGLIRHRGKLFAIRHNAQTWLNTTSALTTAELQGELSPMTHYLWQFAFLPQAAVMQRLSPRQQDKIHSMDLDQQRSWLLSMHLKNLGFKFVGHQICHAFMQAVGMFNHHDPECFCYLHSQTQRQTAIERYFSLDKKP